MSTATSLINSISQYQPLLTSLETLSPAEKTAHLRNLCKTDLYFLLRYGLKRPDAEHPWIFDRCREVQASPNGHLDLWAREHFKAVQISEPVPTPNGWKKHGDLVAGDMVFGIDGQPCRVTGRTPVFVDADCWRVTFDDGYSVVVSGDHLWSLKRKHKPRVNGTNIRHRNVFSQQVVDTRTLATMKGRRDVGVSAPINHPERELLLDPYILGIWLGDGNSTDATISCGGQDIEHLERELTTMGMPYQKRKDRTAWRILLNPRDKHRLGVLADPAGKKVGARKHIPDAYLRASTAQRLALLQGLMDTDGTADKRGRCIFANTNEELIDGAFELAASLGLKPTKLMHLTKYKGRPYRFWFVSFQGFKNFPAFRMARKLARCKDERPFNHWRFVKSVVRCETVPVSCIQVDRQDGTYLIGKSFVPTHNSSIITVALTIQDILNDPDITVGILSHTRPIAKAFLRQIKREFENNDALKSWFPDVLYAEPFKQSPKWAEDEGLIVKRKSNPKEATIEAWGLVDGQPTSRHYKLIVYDDVVTRESVTTPDMIAKVNEAWELSRNLTSGDGTSRYIGTRYHYSDTWGEILRRKAATPRIHPATVDGTISGEPVLLSRSRLETKRKELGPYTFSCQLLLNPLADETQGFKADWLKTYDAIGDGEGMNKYILVDPASSKKRDSDYTCMVVIGLGADDNYYILDMVRDRLSLTERAEYLFTLHKRWKPSRVGYEQYGMQSDIEHIKYRQNQENYRFDIVELKGQVSKIERIRRLIPVCQSGRLFFPATIWRTNYEGRLVELVTSFVEEEFKPFPVGMHDDMLDAISRVLDENLSPMWPKGEKPKDRYSRKYERKNTSLSWMSA